MKRPLSHGARLQRRVRGFSTEFRPAFGTIFKTKPTRTASQERDGPSLPTGPPAICPEAWSTDVNHAGRPPRVPGRRALSRRPVRGCRQSAHDTAPWTALLSSVTGMRPGGFTDTWGCPQRHKRPCL
uniref:Uncharacterized protein n=1 Tax=Rousettus aegyptiacus TaxID=9407 RepID=A0A7J8BEG2_ROUAE|nr:hypothetical protein HJG63_009765 [Rousettus aegyptiacus]